MPVYSSSIGVLGCKINTNRVAYWPSAVDCNNICVKDSHEGRHVYLLKIDSSGGAHDISYDAWNFLKVGRSASEDPEQGGGIPMSYNFPSLLPALWELCAYNIYDPVCKYGADGKCHLNPSISNLPECPGGLESTKKLDHKVENILFGSGKSAAAP
ncbi:hypothetical protein Forpe1208_v016062 [Fusarium oxysporum f. sp. rapae]|uniref:Uncharacterized protein n=1 Tax=Fusarium oxysporum f. sp. rapae TaxID=485398 RepID=A0A8J5NGQ4_FUSOX|nr:hypothetical protein Forpe1208_v016062 [Fusarium oxysporum f. sp. rapae]